MLSTQQMYDVSSLPSSFPIANSWTFLGDMFLSNGLFFCLLFRFAVVHVVQWGMLEHQDVPILAPVL
eukprot:12179232-Prorocentrum_lima.AAC.1